MIDPLDFQIDHSMADLRPSGPMSPLRSKRIISDEHRKHRLSDTRLLENLFMVSTGIRSTSMFHPESIEEILQVHEIAGELGIGMVVRKCGIQVYKVFIFSRQKEDLAYKIPDLYESMGFNEFILAQITMANLTGDFLDFPQCCRESFIGHLMEGTDQDQEAHEKLRQDRSPDPRAYFVERFVPCDPHCENAVAEGSRLEKRLHIIDGELGEKYMKLRIQHMNDVRNGVIIKEKRSRDEMLGLKGKVIR